MSFTQDIKIEAMVACGRRCAICHKFCGNNMEVHHIKQHADGGADTFDNAIPVCFDCHAEIGQYDTRHPKGIKFTEKELLQHRDNWYRKVAASSALITDPKYIELDRVTYHTLNEYLPQNVLEYLRDMDFGGHHYPVGYFEKLELFSDFKVYDPHLEYIDSDLESAKANLANSLCNFFSDRIPYLFPDDGKFVRVPREWEDNLPDQYNKAVNLLNKDADFIWEMYCEYIKICRRKLQVT